jgi:subtilisin family serine protease
MRHLEDMQIQMRLNILKQKVAVGLSALLLATPMSVFAQNSRLSQKLADGQGLEPTRQELATLPEEGKGNGAAGRHKIAPDLDQSVDAVSYRGGRDKTQRVIIQLKDNKGLQKSGILIADSAGILLGDAAQLQNKLARYNGKVNNIFRSLGMISAEVPLSRIREMEYDDEIAYVSPDRPVASNGHVETTTGAGQTDGRDECVTLTSLNGTGVGIAVLDSGIDNTHNLIKPSTGRPSVVYYKTYTTVAANRDYFGHGTHVASLLAGSPAFKSDYYGGIAYEAKLISLGVLDGSGKGLSSNVIAAIDWCIANKATYNIRVINMSLGTPVKDSYKTDPLCLAARRAYNAESLSLLPPEIAAKTHSVVKFMEELTRPQSSRRLSQ